MCIKLASTDRKSTAKMLSPRQKVEPAGGGAAAARARAAAVAGQRVRSCSRLPPAAPPRPARHTPCAVWAARGLQGRQTHSEQGLAASAHLQARTSRVPPVPRPWAPGKAPQHLRSGRSQTWSSSGGVYFRRRAHAAGMRCPTALINGQPIAGPVGHCFDQFLKLERHSWRADTPACWCMSGAACNCRRIAPSHPGIPAHPQHRPPASSRRPPPTAPIAGPCLTAIGGPAALMSVSMIHSRAAAALPAGLGEAAARPRPTPVGRAAGLQQQLHSQARIRFNSGSSSSSKLYLSGGSRLQTAVEAAAASGGRRPAQTMCAAVLACCLSGGANTLLIACCRRCQEC